MFSDENLFNFIIFFILLMSLPTFILAQFFTSPYGKHKRSCNSGTTISPPLAWAFMESPTLWLTFLIFRFGKNNKNPLSYVLISPFIFHYTNRTIIYPLRLYFGSKPISKKSTSHFPLNIAVTGFIYNILNSYIQCRWVSHYADYESNELFWVRFCGGLVVFAGGMVVNVWADGVLLGLKSEGVGYKIPRSGLFEYVSSPNYLGEIVEWLGWALMTWSWAGLAFFVYTCANLVPRAVSNHKWYLEKFGEDYPKNRKAVFPFLY
ncbi:steroid 5-alpha-reductase DET2 isoform X1 [Lycium ferocissimum]|uniref:steroid 5-alpha-reductase DET2 isoform X1 n=1 Tax=Lycium ferocissimum TaxID=112874 RepID=UPI0028167052|nr:steroid 5-alpha-reductase DET2 isoform X1 [Lycium ferocissimum]